MINVWLEIGTYLVLLEERLRGRVQFDINFGRIHNAISMCENLRTFEACKFLSENLRKL